MSTKPASTIATKPHPRVWWGLLLLPAATIILVAMPVGIIVSLTNWAPAPHLLIAIWAVISVAIIAWCAIRDPELLTYTLTDSDMRRGKRRERVVFRFDEIESIVIGVPARFPWFLRWMQINPTAYNGALAVRSASIFVRLHGRRRMPLNFVTNQFLNGREVMQEFINRNSGKIVGRETFTGQELRKMERADLNRIFVVR